MSIENQITCGGGNWQSEVYWSLSNPTGETIATGGAPFEGCVGGTCEPEIIESFGTVVTKSKLCFLPLKSGLGGEWKRRWFLNKPGLLSLTCFSIWANRIEDAK